MNKRKKLGQHFLVSQSIAQKIVHAANITDEDTVLEIGTGRGILTPILCKNAKKVISIDVDRTLYEQAREKFSFDNLELLCGDGFKTEKRFSILVSNLPYSKSKSAIQWLCQKKLCHAVIMIQKEFSEKLFAQRHAVAIIANYCFEIKEIIKVGKNNFMPAPKIDSVVIKLVQKHTLSYDVIKTVNLLFSHRRKTLANILKKYDITSDSKQRLDDLESEEIIKIAKQICKL